MKFSQLQLAASGNEKVRVTLKFVHSLLALKVLLAPCNSHLTFMSQKEIFRATPRWLMYHDNQTTTKKYTLLVCYVLKNPDRCDYVAVRNEF